MRRTIAAFAIAASFGVGLAACGDDDDDGGAATSGSAAAPASTGSGSAGAVDPSKPEVHVALVSLKIPGSDLLTPYTVGANAAADQINASGGIGGRKLVIDDCNTQNQAPLAVTCARKLAKDDPVAFIGCDNVTTTAGLKVYTQVGAVGIFCLNTPADFTNPDMFGVDPGGVGQQIAMARNLCTRPDVKTVGMQMLDFPGARSYEAPVRQVIEGCGKKIDYTYVALTATDLTPTVQKVMSTKPDFIMTFALSGPQTVQIFKAFQQAQFPSSKMFTMSSSLDYETMLKPAGSSMDGVTMFLPYANMEDTSNPDVAAYNKALEGASMDAFNSNVQTGYVYVNTIYTAAKAIGFDKFDGASLKQFLSTQNGVHLPMNRELVNPGPTAQPQIKQPYAQMVVWKDGKLTTVADGTEDGWVKGTP